MEKSGAMTLIRILMIFNALAYLLHFIMTCMIIANYNFVFAHPTSSYYYVFEAFLIKLDIFAVIVYCIGALMFTKCLKTYTFFMHCYSYVIVYSFCSCFPIVLRITSDLQYDFWIQTIQAYFCAFVNFVLVAIMYSNRDVIINDVRKITLDNDNEQVKKEEN